MDTEGVCWVCSTAFTSGERVTRMSSLGIEVHARCAHSVLYDEPPPPDRNEWLADSESDKDDAAA
jgi:hypothetical protein